MATLPPDKSYLGNSVPSLRFQYQRLAETMSEAAGILETINQIRCLQKACQRSSLHTSLPFSQGDRELSRELSKNWVRMEEDEAKLHRTGISNAARYVQEWLNFLETESENP